MKLVLFDDHRLGVVDGTGERARVVDVTDALGWPHDPDPLTAGWWRRLCRDFPEARGRLAEAAEAGESRPLETVRLLAPAVNPSKIVACACNYADHVAEMHGVQERTLGGVESWMMDFDVFLKSPSSLSGPADDIVLPEEIVAAGQEIHHESELVIVVGTGGRDIPEARALDHVLGYTLGLDITVRSAADRSRRKSYDTFSPLGPVLVTADEIGDPGALEILLDVNGGKRQHVNTRDLLTPVPAIVSYASRMMTLLPGDLIFTGAPPGVGAIEPGDTVRASITGVGAMTLAVRQG
ncbi:fumarylacetoacetate hydrolase family protein [Streptomyces profundus]|uniref:fumarylacetoacetate hydrolase family protein n=1 Tax=Streptomyces profundus TaxID=2867410 RepID=UPI001D16B8B4|nr:fumarylacetoacetate hydrolase family protein [Streptomyces sp. MA3_2.13]UED87999.1 fumarylacetoacetate hydrolase family protein [Streptomyces sp. MA3_2.13]